MNGGECTNGKNQFACTCSSGWTGPTCEIEGIVMQQSSIKIHDAVNLLQSISHRSYRNYIYNLLT